MGARVAAVAHSRVGVVVTRVCVACVHVPPRARRCPYSERVWLAMELKGLTYDTVLIDNMGSRPGW